MTPRLPPTHAPDCLGADIVGAAGPVGMISASQEERVRGMRLVPLATVMLACAAVALLSAAQGTPEQRAACQDDAMRLCGQFVPDVQQITACMHGKRRYLTARCRAVFDSGSKRRRAGI